MCDTVSMCVWVSVCGQKVINACDANQSKPKQTKANAAFFTEKYLEEKFMQALPLFVVLSTLNLVLQYTKSTRNKTG